VKRAISLPPVMFKFMKTGARRRVLVLACACLLMILALSGCQTIRFYSQAVAGQYEILVHQTPLDELIKDPGTDPKLKAQLELVLKIRQFAAQELKLRPDGSYLKYVDLHRPFVVWNVNVAPRLSLEPKTWWFPIVGSASYRGYFSQTGARRYAAIWEKKGWDACVGDVTTYSTLGWFKDPLLNTFIFESEADLADTIFHELTHELLFIAGDTDFNEALATMVAQEGVRRWFRESPDARGYERYAEGVLHDNDFVKLVMATRDDLQKVYDDARLPEAAKLQRKAEIIAQMRIHYATLKASWGVSKSGYDEWFAEPVNNAQLNTVAAYYDLVPAFQALLRAQGGDMDKFYKAAGDLAKEPLPKRHEALHAYLNTR
jgi:predicted aminopeptidase